MLKVSFFFLWNGPSYYRGKENLSRKGSDKNEVYLSETSIAVHYNVIHPSFLFTERTIPPEKSLTRRGQKRTKRLSNEKKVGKFYRQIFLFTSATQGYKIGSGFIGRAIFSSRWLQNMPLIKLTRPRILQNNTAVKEGNVCRSSKDIAWWSLIPITILPRQGRTPNIALANFYKKQIYN